MQKDQKLQKPFFSAFMEQQLENKAEANISGAGENQTQKYPSDKEDDYTKPALDMAQTQKYPSDGDDDIQTVPL